MNRDAELLEVASTIAVQAGREIMSVYRRDAELAVETKADDSPLTEADRRAHYLIETGLEALEARIPVLSEESGDIAVHTRRSWAEYWLVDPLDGTREFISRNGEFTVNIALIRDGEPVLGVVHVPVTGVTYRGQVGEGAWCSRPGRLREPLEGRPMTSGGALHVVGSRRHGAEAVDAMLGRLRLHFRDIGHVSMGSSLKICVLAEGGADLYPRLGPTSEWDTAAAHAILRASGGEIYGDDFQPLRYNARDSLLNPHFFAVADRQFPWPDLLKEVTSGSPEDDPRSL